MSADELNPGPPPVIEVIGVSKIYPGVPPTVALDHCDLQIMQGDYWAVTGASGSGKSTMLNLLGLLDVPTSGNYLLEGLETTALSEQARTALRARRIGFVLQAFHLIPNKTAAENVELALLYSGVRRRERTERAVHALTGVGLGHRINARPTTMSGGERQRVAIARAIVHQPALLLCDEPTGSLDSVNTASLMDLLDDLHEHGATLVVVTHDANVASRAEHAMTMRDGRLSIGARQ